MRDILLVCHRQGLADAVSDVTLTFSVLSDTSGDPSPVMPPTTIVALNTYTADFSSSPLTPGHCYHVCFATIWRCVTASQVVVTATDMSGSPRTAQSVPV